MTRKKGQTVNERREKLRKEREERIKAREEQKHKKNNEEKQKIRLMKQQLEKQQLEKQQKFKEYIQNKNNQNKNTQTETKNSPEIPPTPNVSPEIPPTPFHCPSESPKQNKPKISLVSQMDKFFIEPVSKQEIKQTHKQTRKETRNDIPTSMLPKITNAWKQGPPSIKKEFDLRVFITVSTNDTNRTKREDLREQARLPSEVPTAKATPLINKTSEEEKNKIRTEGFNIIKDPKKMQEILYKTVFCKYGDKCNREKRGMKCNFYHNEDERRIPECPFKSVCKKHSKGHCKMFHPGQTDWIIKNPLPANCPVATKKSVTTQKRESSNLAPQIGGLPRTCPERASLERDRKAEIPHKTSKVVYENRNELKIEIPVVKKVTIQSSLFNDNKFLFYTQIEKAMKQGMEVVIKND